MAPCSLVGVCRRLRGVYCLHHQGDNDGGGTHLRNLRIFLRVYSAAFYKPVIFIFAAVRTESDIVNALGRDLKSLSSGYHSFVLGRSRVLS